MSCGLVGYVLTDFAKCITASLGWGGRRSVPQRDGNRVANCRASRRRKTLSECWLEKQLHVSCNFLPVYFVYVKWKRFCG
jgi:hypothetical protein